VTPQLTTKPFLARGTYFVRHERLYYVLDYELDTLNILVENCATLHKEWFTAIQLDEDGYRIVRRRRGTRVAHE
jgi:hypothetical protein